MNEKYVVLITIDKLHKLWMQVELHIKMTKSILYGA